MELVRREVERLSAQHSRYPDHNHLLISHIVIMSRSDSLLRHYIANAWLAKLDTVAEPGPIDNSSVICQHGGVRFNRHIVYIFDAHHNVSFCFRVDTAAALCTAVPREVLYHNHHSCQKFTLVESPAHCHCHKCISGKTLH